MIRKRLKYFIMVLTVLIISCSATRLGGRSTMRPAQDTTVMQQQPAKKIQAIPDEQLLPSEVELKQQAAKTIQKANKAIEEPATNKELVEAITNSNQMVAELYSESVEARKQRDSLRYVNNKLEQLLNRQYQSLQNLDQNISDEAKAGRALRGMLNNISIATGAILITLIVIALLLWVIQQVLKNEKKTLIKGND